MKNWLRNIKNFFRNIFWRNENETIIIEDKFPVEASFEKESMNNSEEELENYLVPNEEKELIELLIDSENIDSNFPLEIETIEIKEKVKNNSNDLLKNEEFPTLTHHKIELEKKPQPKKKHVIKKKKTTHLTPKQHHSKGLTIKLPENRKIK